MSGDYLWDRSGAPDPDVVRLEEALKGFAYRPAPRTKGGSWRQLIPFAAAAAVVVAVALTLMRAQPQPAHWESGGKQMYIGQVVRTAESSVVLEAGEVGRVEIGPDSEVRIGQSRAELQQLRLEQGRIHALIWAPPQKFVVETASSRAVDLGCEYTLEVDKDGTGLLRVETGWVAFQHGGRESFIPAGARCTTDRKYGPGLPYFEDAPERFRNAVSTYERTNDARQLAEILRLARPSDGLTLWHLFPRVPADQLGPVFDAFARLVKLPPEVNREAIIRVDRAAIDAAWNALNLEDADWWREWKRSW